MKKEYLIREKPWKALLVFVFPMIIGNLFQQLYTMVDSIVVGQYVGENALAAVGASYSLTAVFISVAIGGGIGASVITSRYFGSRHYQKMKNSIKTALLAFCVISITLAAIGWIFSRQMMIALNTPMAVLEDAVLYLKIYFLGAPFLMLYNFCAAIFRSRGETRLPMLCLVFGGVIKVLLDLLFVVLFNWGVAGMALATVCANALSAFMLILFLMRRTDELKLRIRSIKADSKIVFALLKIGLPSSFLGSIFSISNLCMQSAINSWGADAIPASTAAAAEKSIMASAGTSQSVAEVKTGKS